MDEAARKQIPLFLPKDYVAAPDVTAAATVTTADQEIPPDMLGVDIGQQTIAAFHTAIHRAHTLFGNGSLGICETPPFNHGAMAVAQAVVASDCFSVVGGGDTRRIIVDGAD